MSSSLQRFPRPPRLLLGAAVVVWGGLTDHPFSALAAALLIEACHWLGWRWRFGRTGYSRAWILSLFALAGTVSYHSLNSTGPEALLSFLEVLPLIFLPLILAQQYGEEGAIPGTVFSLWARIRQKRDEKLGKAPTDHLLHFGYPYFALTLLSTGYEATGSREQWSYFLVLTLLSAAGIYYAHRRDQRRVLPWLTVLVLVTALSSAGSQSLINLREWLKKRNYFQVQGNEQLQEQNTAIGRLGDLKLDRRLQWRLQVADGAKVPDRVMTKAFNFYRQGKWQAWDPDYNEYDLAFRDLLRPVVDGNEGEFAFEAPDFLIDDEATSSTAPYRIRGAVSSNRKPFPSPAAPQLFVEAEEVDAIESSSLGTLLAINAGAVVDIGIWPGANPSLRESAPRQRVRSEALLDLTELSLPEPTRRWDEAGAIRDLAEQLNLAEMTDQQKLDTIFLYFQENFTYTTHLRNRGGADSSAVMDFLTKSRRGHCEYFATAATLLMRAAGVPSRYIVGFAVQERSDVPGEYLLRGTHSHAWCRAYIGGTRTLEEETLNIVRNGQTRTVTHQREVWTGGKWVDLDVTPPDWLKLDSPPPTTREKLADTLQKMREDFQIWRSDSQNRGWVNAVLAAIFIAVLSFVAWRLSRSRIREQREAHSQAGARPSSSLTPLNAALPKLEKHLGKRPPGQTLSRWLLRDDVTSATPGERFSTSDLTRMLELHEQTRFAPRPTEAKDSLELKSLVSDFLRTCSQRKST